ncbi:MAG: hypothetical protein ACJAS1_003000 [Oleiphilaceae bacterium]|jgi:hypothetical protein
MKKKTKLFEQHLFHEYVTEEAESKYLDAALSLIGTVVMDFNGLESSLDSFLCELFTDKSDSVGLIVLHRMPYSAKVDLFKRFCDDFHYGTAKEIDGYKQLVNSLRESGRLRNLVVHADWEKTDDEGFTYVSFKQSKMGMEQEYIQFSGESLYKIVDVILDSRKNLSAYWEARENIFESWGKDT